MTDITSILSNNNFRFLSKTFPNDSQTNITRTVTVDKLHQDTSTTGVLFYYSNGNMTYRLSKVLLKKGQRPTELRGLDEPLHEATADISKFLGLATNWAQGLFFG